MHAEVLNNKCLDIVWKICSLRKLENKQYHRKVLLNSFHLNADMVGLNPQTEKRRTILYSVINSTTETYSFVAFIWMVTL